jgi:hypothetical protein
MQGRRPAHLGQQENTAQDAQNGRSARPQRAKGRGGTYRTSCVPSAHKMDLGERISPSSVSNIRKALFNVEPLSEARTMLADFFSILLDLLHVE